MNQQNNFIIEKVFLFHIYGQIFIMFINTLANSEGTRTDQNTVYYSFQVYKMK